MAKVRVRYPNGNYTPANTEYGIVIPEGYTGIRQMIITSDGVRDNIWIMELIRYCVDNVGGVTPAHLIVNPAHSRTKIVYGRRLDPRDIFNRGFAMHPDESRDRLANLRAFTFDPHYVENFTLKLSLYGLPDEWFERLRYYSNREKLRRDLADSTNRTRRWVIFDEMQLIEDSRCLSR